MHIPKLIGHRGLKALAPENTLASFKKAKLHGFTWIEFDVMLAACGTPVVFHDASLNRTTNGKGRVANKSYPELAKLDAGRWFSEAFYGERIPTLQQTLEYLGKLDLHANIELKPSRGKEVITAQKTHEIIQEYWAKQQVKPLISSFSLASLYTIHALDNSLPIGILYRRLPRDWHKTADELNCSSIHLNQLYINQAQIKQIKQTQRLVLTYTVNDEQRAKQLLDSGVNAIFTDYPLFTAKCQST